MKQQMVSANEGSLLDREDDEALENLSDTASEQVIRDIADTQGTVLAMASEANVSLAMKT